jgi:hypothetical protein
MADSAPDDPALTAAFRRCGVSVRDIWIAYLALGGNADEVSIEAQLYGLIDLPVGEYNVLAHTVNEELEELPEHEREPRVPYLPVRAGERLPGQSAGAW